MKNDYQTSQLQSLLDRKLQVQKRNKFNPLNCQRYGKLFDPGIYNHTGLASNYMYHYLFKKEGIVANVFSLRGVGNNTNPKNKLTNF